tara:strand:+ start:45 stop:800 length:756 start_codon:yes stop_codon:yes gene_type:complete
MDDKVISQLREFTDYDGNITFDVIRKFASFPDVSVWDQLGRGRNILKTQDQLNQYMYSYGKMVKSQWMEVLKTFDLGNDKLEIIDYACGQGLASVLFLDKFYKTHKNLISKITLIEPSSVAIHRAKEILSFYNPTLALSVISKKLDDVTGKELVTDIKNTKIHLFSNILDIEGFNIFDLFNKILDSKGRHTFLAVSHDREFSGGSQRLRDIYDFMVDPKYKKEFKMAKNQTGTFVCENGTPAIFFLVTVEV